MSKPVLIALVNIDHPILPPLIEKNIGMPIVCMGINVGALPLEALLETKEDYLIIDREPPPVLHLEKTERPYGKKHRRNKFR